jgi:YD repeat-containing protein
MRQRQLIAAASALGAILGVTAPAAALQGPGPGAVSASTLKLPDKPASVHGLSDAASLNAFSGQVSYAIPIELPQGPAGFGPSLALNYSGELGNGSLGIGWRLSGTTITRSLRQGVPRYDDSDELDLEGIGSEGRLIRDPAIAGRYWVEGQGHAIRVDRQGSHFEVYDGAGNHYFLGVDSEGIEGVSGKTRGWHLEWMENVVGQKIRFHYLRDGNHLYLSSISWGPNNAFLLTVAHEGRPDVHTSYRTGYEVRTALRVSRLTVTAFGETARSYELTYDDTTFPVSRLVRVHMRGRGGVGALPDLTLTYVKATPAQVVQLENVGGWVLESRGVTLLDVDGDGMSDLARLELGNHQYRKNIGSGKFADPRPLSGAGDVDLQAGTLMDVDGDAHADLVHVVNDTWRVEKLVGEEWQSVGPWAGTVGVPLHAVGAVLADINGDGRTDVIQGRASGLLINFGRGGGLTAGVALPRIQTDAETEPGNKNVRFVDMNGDGLTDVAWLTDGWMKLFAGTGDGHFVPFAHVVWPWLQARVDPVVNLDDLVLADLDRDGLIDLIRFTAGNVVWYPGLTGGRLSPTARAVGRPEGAAADAIVTVGDINGNGSADIVWSSPRGLWALDIAGVGTAGMLATISNGLGKSTTISYSTSALLSVQAEQAGKAWEQKLPASIPVAVQTDIDPGAGGPPRLFRIGVRDGLWDGQERRFAGFLTAEQASGAERNEDVRFEETFFNAGLGASRVLRGKPRIVRVSNGNGALISVATNDWEALPVSGLPDSPLTRKAALKETLLSTYEGTQTPTQVRTTFDFDDEVRPIVETHLGTSVVGDEKITRRRFASDDVTWVRDRVYFEEVTDGAGVLAARSQIYFGGPTGDPLSLGTIGVGFVRQNDAFLLDEGRWIAQSMRSYDACGNATSIYEQGVSRVVGYDAACLHPVSESVIPADGAPALVWTMSWDNVIGQPVTLTDPNGDVSRVGYDQLGRVIALSVNDAAPYARTIYEWLPPQPRTTSCLWDGPLDQVPADGSGCPGGAGWRTTVAVANGAAEELFSSTTLRDGRFIVSGWSERDARGQIVLSADAFYSTVPFPAARPSTPDLRITTYHYDALGRLDLTTLANGSQKRTIYLPLQQTVVTTGMAPVTSYQDGIGRVVRTERTVETGLESVDASYDAADRILTLTLEKGPGQVVHSFTYDTLGRLRHATDPDTGSRDLIYDDRNLLRQNGNALGQNVYFDYDLAGRLIRRGETAALNAGSDYTYVYDDDTAALGSGCRGRSRNVAVIEPSGQIHSCYDVFGRTSGFGRSISAIDTTSTTGGSQRLFAASGLLLSEVFDDGLAISYRYDPGGRLVAASAGDSDVWVADATDAASRVTNEHYGNGATETYGYDQLGLSSHVAIAAAGGASLYDVSVIRNAFGAPTLVTDNDNHVGLDQNANYSYDTAGRLIGATMGGAAAGPFTFTYAYDALQNMTQRTVTGPQEIGVLTGTYRYGERGYGPRQLTSVVPGGTQ